MGRGRARRAELWHYFWKTRGGTHIGNRGLGMYGNWLYMETPDDYLVSLDARTGKERWHKEIASFEQQYFSTAAPMVVGNHVLVGTGDDLDEPGLLQAFDPETGDVQWKFYTVPMKAGDPGAGHVGEPGRGAARRRADVGAGLVRSGDASLHHRDRQSDAGLHIGEPGEGDNLYTCSIVAINVDTGKMAWYYQTSPHDTHDWDSAQTPVLVDGMFNGKPRKMVLTATRNGYYFTLDRADGRASGDGKIFGLGQLGEGIYGNGRADARSGEGFRYRRARWCRRPTAASRIGRRRRTVPTRACFTCRRTTATRCTT